MDDTQFIPPTIKLLLEEDFGDLTKPNEFLRRYRRAAKEIARQAEWTRANFQYLDEANPSPGSLIVTASGSLNPMSSTALCAAPSCRIHSAIQMARTIGLYADIVAIPDVLTPMLANEPKPTASQAVWLSTQIRVVRELAP